MTWPFTDPPNYATTDADTAADFLDQGQAEKASKGEQHLTMPCRRATCPNCRAHEQPRHRQRASFSRAPQTPLEKVARDCGAVQLYRRPEGGMRAVRVDCRTKACPKCGPRRRAEYATGYTTVLATAGPLYRLQLPDAHWRRLQAKLGRRGAPFLRIPTPAGQLTIYTTAPDQGGYLVDAVDLADLLAADFAAMPSERRNYSASTDWRESYHRWCDAQDQDDAAPAGEWLGILGRPLAHVAIIAAELGMLEREAGSSLYLRDPPDADTWRRFCVLARLRQPTATRAAARMK